MIQGDDATAVRLMAPAVEHIHTMGGGSREQKDIFRDVFMELHRRLGHVPAWKSEHEVTSDPRREVALIYYGSRAGLEERVWRIRSGTSPASTPMPRTPHAVTNVVVLDTGGAERLHVASVWTTHLFMTKHKATHCFFGRYEHGLLRRGPEWKIARKKVILLNDYIPTVLDVYSV